jgi:alpha-mannosidase
VLGEMTSRGRLLDRQGKPLAGFRQVTRLRRGSRVLELEIELDPQQEPQAEPWNSYYANRIAWQDEASDLYQTVNGFRYKTDGKRLEAPQFLEVESEKNRTTLFCGGLPFHRRQGMRMLDTLLIVRGERARQFRLGIGVDVPYPIHEAQHFLTDPLVERLEGRQPSGAASAWLFHLDAKTVSVTFWQPLQEEGTIVGFRARLLESRGRSVRAKLSAFREVASARLRDFCGNPLGECAIKDGAVSISLAAHEWVEVEARLCS